MKKTIIRIVVLILLILISISIIFLGVGYSKYSDTLKEQSLSSKVKEIQSDENYAKLEEINNVIENILKINNKWADIDYKNESFDFISNDSVIKYRKLIHCFRHGSEDSIKEREKISKNQKEFLINYGITICELLLNAIRNKNES